MPKRGYIKDGKYYSNEGRPTDMIEPESPTFAPHQRDMQRVRHQHDLIQPYMHGNPNPEFIREYPDESEGYFGIEIDRPPEEYR